MRSAILTSSVASLFTGKDALANDSLQMRTPPFNARTSTTRQVQKLTKVMLEPFTLSPNNLRKMKDSYLEIILPFSVDKKLQEEYVDAFGGVRIGKIIEDMDALAGSIAYKHCLVASSSSMESTEDSDEILLPLIIVTASVDRIDLQHNLDIKENIRLSGCVSYVGTSSMEVLIIIDKQIGDEWITAASALFTMVARDPVLHTAVPVPRLSLVMPEERELFNSSADRRSLRRSLLSNTEPNASELEHLHSLFTRHQTGLALTSDYFITSLRLCHPQERNIHNFVFGGYLMKEAFELAVCLSSVYCKESPTFSSLDESAFLLPVPIGSLLSLNALVVFVEGFHVRIQVSIFLLDLSDSINNRNLTNKFGFTFENRRKEPLSGLQPSTYLDGLEYLQARRKHHASVEEVALGRSRWVSLLKIVTTSTEDT